MLAAGFSGIFPAPAGAAGLVEMADPLVGTGNSATDPKEQPGGTFPGATLPFGMVGFSPDTWSDRTNLRGGYSHGERWIKDFTVTQFSGAGCAIYQDLPIVARAGNLSGPGVNPADFRPRFLQRYSHSRESASPGFYGVTLSPGTRREVRADLTATRRTAVGRFRFTKSRTGTLTFDAGGSRMGNHHARVKISPGRREITGTSVSGHFCFEPRSTYRVHYVIRFDRPFREFGTWQKTSLRRGSTGAEQHSRGGYARAGAYATFATGKRRTVTVRIGLSFVSLAGARRNLRENRGLGFAGVRKRARQTWSKELDTVRIGGGLPEDRRNFASALYHSLTEPSIANDRDGRYLGMDGKVHRVKGRNHYTDISGWDIYRSQIPLLAMIKPKVASDIARSLVDGARQSGCLPRWPYANQQTNVMVGDPSDPMIASTWALGARDFDSAAALGAMIKGGSERCHTRNGDYTEREALDDYLALGYVPQERNVDDMLHSVLLRSEPWGTASTTLEYALADFTISRFADSLGRNDVAATFRSRSGNWRHLVNEVTGEMQPRLSTGEFAPGFTPGSKDGWVEGNSAQYNWFVPQDPAGLFDSMGGRPQATVRLDQFFTRIQAGQGSPFAYFGNEPTFLAPWLYNWLGLPARGQKVIRDVQTGLFRPTPGGLPGNDDGGAMSAWYVLSALGLYPAVPGTDILAIGSPLFPRATVRLRKGSLGLAAPAASRGRPYVTDMKVKGVSHTAPWLRFSDIAGGGRIEWDLADTPGTWGMSPADTPPSFAP
ncbi:MAG: GH92 family glycosyl hydrolase [Solirubrobacterales bacterium]|nr:GH92 family glycosyl hydrolase [Solirubrobacterales bacterium]